VVAARSDDTARLARRSRFVSMETRTLAPPRAAASDRGHRG
jgi:hypothetical protein